MQAKPRYKVTARLSDNSTLSRQFDCEDKARNCYDRTKELLAICQADYALGLPKAIESVKLMGADGTTIAYSALIERAD